MRNIFCFLVLLLFFQATSAQNLSNQPEITIHTKFTLELIPKDSERFDYRILETEVFHDTIKSSLLAKALSDSLQSNQVQGIFTTGYFGNKPSNLLVLKTGNDAQIEYSLFIRPINKRRFKETSTTSVSRIPTTEVWQNQLASLKFSNFRRKVLNTTEIEFTPIDTTCVSQYNLSKGNLLFKEQLPFILEVVSDSNSKRKVEINKIKSYEDSINLISKSSWGYLSKLLIKKDERYFDGYINSSKIAQPLVFELTECPFLKRSTAYFFRKWGKDIRLVAFD